jgi:hypothetical protein
VIDRAPLTLTPNQIVRYRRKVDVRGAEDCWPWTGSRSSNGRPNINVDKVRNAARVGWLIEHGAWPAHYVCHRCDNRACMNPAHWFDGTPAENMADASAKNRLRRGEDNRSAKLTTDAVLAIRARCSAGESQRSVAAAYGIHQVCVSLIVRRLRWAHVS